jgi:hypothetical protein
MAAGRSDHGEGPMLEKPRPISGVADVIELLERAW